MMQRRLDCVADTNARSGRSAANRHLDTAKIVLEYRADPHTQTNVGVTPDIGEKPRADHAIVIWR